MTTVGLFFKQIPFGPPVEEANYPTQSASMADHLNVLNLLESKLSSLMELVKSLDAIKAEPTTANTNPNNNPDLLYSQVKPTFIFVSIPFLIWDKKSSTYWQINRLFHLVWLVWHDQVGQLSLPSSPRMPGDQNSIQPADQSGAAAAAAAAMVGGVGAAVAVDRAGRPVNPKLRSNESGSDEDQVPTRGFLKRQTRIIVEAKTKKQNQRPRKGD